MKKQKINYINSIQLKKNDKKNFKKLSKKFSDSFNKISNELNLRNNPFHSLSEYFRFDFNQKDLQNFKNFKTVVVIGIGGSILGSEAIYSFLRKKVKKKFFFLDNIDLSKLQEIEQHNKKHKTLFIIISKSGNTTETLSNILSLKIIKKNSKNIIIIAEKSNNILFNLSKKFNLKFFEHKFYIGGRYSVLSEVGMLPACLMGINTKNLRSNVLKHFKKNGQNFLKKSVLILSTIMMKNKFKNIVFLNYIPELEKFLYWAQQLIAESLGKKGIGFLPIVSSAPKDHHSLLQLYLEGPKDKIFYIFSLDQNNGKKINSKIFGKKMSYLNNKNLNQIKKAQKNSFIYSLKTRNIPFREFRIKDLNENILGELFSYFMLETALVGKLCNINPYNQPSVEEVKNNTKKILN